MRERERTAVQHANDQRAAPARRGVVQLARGAHDIDVVAFDGHERRLVPHRMTAANHRDAPELRVHRRRRLAPLERVAFPRIVPRLAPMPQRQREIHEKQEHA